MGALIEAFARIEREWQEKRPAQSRAKGEEKQGPTNAYAASVRSETRLVVTSPELHAQQYLSSWRKPSIWEPYT